MKAILLIRHAKSSWAIAGQDDFDRPLNDRGHRDALMMAARVKERKVHIDAFVSSPANRAITTAGYFAKEWEVAKKNIIEVKKLYHAMPSVFLEVISALDDDIKTAALFSHNPGITAMVNLFGVAQLDDMPTCAVFAVKADVKHWKDFAEAPKEFWFFDHPKS